MNVAAQAVQLGNGHVAFEFPSGCQSGLELRAALKRVRAPCFDLHELTDDLEALGLSELNERAPRSNAPVTTRKDKSTGAVTRAVLILFLCLFLPKTDRVTVFELSGCLDGHAL
jgi:hypothetical protein